jgi:hypothetical protein
MLLRWACLFGFVAVSITSTSAAENTQNTRHWAFQPVRPISPPNAKDNTWNAAPLDRFIQARLEARGLAPSVPTDKYTLIRRATFDLIGLPPTSAEVLDFERDSSPHAFAKVIDRLLASPRYGERWGRHWLDVARYADSKGYVFQEERRYPFSYTYRDYVVRAFNNDLPYDRFILEQLAADRLPLGNEKQPLAAMGFLTLGRRFLNNTHDIIDDRIDVSSRGLMGLTVTCARCHDHKFDPIPTKDYYSLYGVFASSIEPRDLPLLVERVSGPLGEAFQKELDRLKAEKAKFEKDNEKELAARNRKFQEQLRAIQAKIDKHLATHPGSPPRAMVLNDARLSANPRVLNRGNPGAPGESVPRQFLEVIAGPNRKPFGDGSGRLDLAKAIASPDNPLTARVLVNRVWAWHFGQGLVRTPSDFGVRSEPPSHPELLDWLAARFVADGWSIKNLHRLIMMSQTYQQAGTDRPELTRIDPENRLLGRMNRTRLDFESQRDTLLFVAGQLDSTVGGPPLDLFATPFIPRRTIYGFVDRQNLPGTLRTFDFASPDQHCPQRHETTVPQQALYLLNSPFVQQQARAAARRTIDSDPPRRIEQLYAFIFSRKPAAEEVRLGLAFIGDDKTEAAWVRYAQVLMVSNEFAFVD